MSACRYVVVRACVHVRMEGGACVLVHVHGVCCCFTSTPRHGYPWLGAACTPAAPRARPSDPPPHARRRRARRPPPRRRRRSAPSRAPAARTPAARRRGAGRATARGSPRAGARLRGEVGVGGGGKTHVMREMGTSSAPAGATAQRAARQALAGGAPPPPPARRLSAAPHARRPPARTLGQPRGHAAREPQHQPVLPNGCDADAAQRLDRRRRRLGPLGGTREMRVGVGAARAVGLEQRHARDLRRGCGRGCVTTGVYIARLASRFQSLVACGSTQPLSCAVHPYERSEACRTSSWRAASSCPPPRTAGSASWMAACEM